MSLSKHEKYLRNQLKIRYNFLRLIDSKLDHEILKKELSNFVDRNFNTK